MRSKFAFDNSMRKIYVLLLSFVFSGCAMLSPNTINTPYEYSPSPAEGLAHKAWDELNKNNFESVKKITDQCIELYAEQAKLLNKKCEKNSFGRSNDCNLLNDVSICLFARFLAQHKSNKLLESESTCGQLNVWYFNAFMWPPGECYGWKPADACRIEISYSIQSD